MIRIKGEQGKFKMKNGNTRIRKGKQGGQEKIKEKKRKKANKGEAKRTI